MNDTKTKNRYFQAVIYPDDPNYDIYLKLINEKFKEVTWITHDRDIQDDEGNIAKKHTHIMFKVGDNARGVKSVAKDIGLEPQYLGGIKKIPFLRYLIHMDNPEKTQYNVKEVHGELAEELKEIVQKNIKEEIQLSEITKEICNHQINTAKDLMIYAINNHMTYTTKKYSYILLSMIGENKDEYRKLREQEEAKREAKRKFIRNIKNRTK